MAAQSLFKWRDFLPEIILLNVRWYCRYPLSYRELEEMMAERGVDVDHSTINRACVELRTRVGRRVRPHLKLTNDSWRVDETYLKVKGADKYLYRAVDSGRIHSRRENSLSMSWARKRSALVRES